MRHTPGEGVQKGAISGLILVDGDGWWPLEMRRCDAHRWFLGSEIDVGLGAPGHLSHHLVTPPPSWTPAPARSEQTGGTAADAAGIAMPVASAIRAVSDRTSWGKSTLISTVVEQNVGAGGAPLCTPATRSWQREMTSSYSSHRPFCSESYLRSLPALPKVSRHQVHQVITDAPFYVQLRKVLMNA